MSDLVSELLAPDLWQNIFTLGATTSIVEKILRPVLVYIFLVVVLRVFGKRELAQLNPFDLIVLLALSNTVQNAIIGNDNSLTGGLIGALALLAINYVAVRFLFRHRRLDQLLEGTATVLLKDGEIKRKMLAKELISQAELTAIAHRQGFARLSEVESIVLETNGTFSIEGKEPNPTEKHYEEVKNHLAKIQVQLESIQKQLAAK